jgi:Domain of unknown function (DUF397)
MLTADWAKSSASNPNGECLEARDVGVVQVRDSKIAATSPVLTFSPAAWETFLVTLR